MNDSVAGGDPQTRADLGTIAENAIGTVGPLLTRDGTFRPLGIRLDAGGTLTIFAYETGPAMDPAGVLTHTHQILRNNCTIDMRAMALVYNGNTIDANGNVDADNAIVVHVDHRGCAPVMLCAPYTLDPQPGGGFDVHVDREMRATAGTSLVFVESRARAT